MQPNEQPSSQIPPDPNTPPTQPVRRTVIQPLSSEDEIRLTASSGVYVQPSEPSINPAKVTPSSVVPTEDTERENTYEGGLRVEPIHQPSQTPLQYSTPQSPFPVATTKAKKPFFKVLTIILSVITIGIIGIVAWLYFFNRVPASNLAQESINILNRESSADLVQESFGQATYLRPKEWVDISASASGYANAKETGNGEMTAIISMSEFSGDSSLNAVTEEERAELRRYYMDTIPDNILGGAMIMNAPMRCEAGTFTVTRSENTTKARTTIGIVDVVATCRRGGTPITMKMRIVAGLNDGRSRMIVAAATDLEWLKNEKTFQQMLDSVEERKAT